MSLIQRSTTNNQLQWISIVLFVCPPLFWAGNFLIGKAVANQVPPLSLLFFRWLIAFVLLLPFALKPMLQDRHIYRRHWLKLIGISLSGIVGFNGFIYIGLQTTTATNAVLLNSFIPILIMLFSAFFFKKTLKGQNIIGAALSFLGIIVILVKGDFAQLSQLSFKEGDIALFCSMICWTFYTLCLQTMPKTLNKIGFLGVQMFVGLVFMTPVFVVMNDTQPLDFNQESTLALLYLGIFPSIIAYIMYNIGTMKLGAAKTSLSIHLVPVFGLLFAALLLKESLQQYQLLGVIMIGSGLVIATGKSMSRRTIEPHSQIQAQ